MYITLTMGCCRESVGEQGEDSHLQQPAAHPSGVQLYLESDRGESREWSWSQPEVEGSSSPESISVSMALLVHAFFLKS